MLSNLVTVPLVEEDMASMFLECKSAEPCEELWWSIKSNQIQILDT